MFKDVFSKLIEENNTNIPKISAETDIPMTTMYDWVHGRTTPKFDYIVKLSKHFNVPIEHFADQEN